MPHRHRGYPACLWPGSLGVHKEASVSRADILLWEKMRFLPQARKRKVKRKDVNSKTEKPDPSRSLQGLRRLRAVSNLTSPPPPVDILTCHHPGHGDFKSETRKEIKNDLPSSPRSRSKPAPPPARSLPGPWRHPALPFQPQAPSKESFTFPARPPPRAHSGSLAPGPWPLTPITPITPLTPAPAAISQPLPAQLRWGLRTPTPVRWSPGRCRPHLERREPPVPGARCPEAVRRGRGRGEDGGGTDGKRRARAASTVAALQPPRPAIGRGPCTGPAPTPPIGSTRLPINAASSAAAGAGGGWGEPQRPAAP